MSLRVRHANGQIMLPTSGYLLLFVSVEVFLVMIETRGVFRTQSTMLKVTSASMIKWSKSQATC